MLMEHEDREGEPGALRAALRVDAALRAGAAPPSLADVECALARIGAVACARGLSARCPLGDACPLRARSAPAPDRHERAPHSPSE
jgi:hypothetical protein